MAERYRWLGPEWDYQDAGPETFPFDGKYYLNGKGISPIIVASGNGIVGTLHGASIQISTVGRQAAIELREALKGVRFTR